MMIQLDKIKYNPYRDTSLDPILDTTVNAMMKSIGQKDDKDALGFWGGLAARKTDEGYELAFGHHRLEALRLLGHTKADIKKVAFNDDQMLRAMITENSTQRGGESGSNIDSVAGIIRRLGYLLLTESDDNLLELKLVNSRASIFPNLQKLSQAKGAFLAGEGLGEKLIHSYELTLQVNSIKNSLASLKKGGRLKHITQKVQEQISKEVVAAQEKADKLKQKVKKDEAQAEADALKAAEELAEEAVENASEESTFDIAVEHVFNRDSHTAAFRDAVTSRDGVMYLPPNGHVAMAEKIIQTNKDDDKTKYLTAKYIKDSVRTTLNKMMALSKLQQQEDSANEAAKAGYKNLVAGVNKASKAAEAILQALSEGGMVPKLANAQAFLEVECAGLSNQLDELNKALHDAGNIVATQ